MKKFWIGTFMLVCWITSHLNAQEVTDLITFKQVDPFLKVLRESNFFPEFTDTVEVAKGENATFQFAVRSGLPLKDLQFDVTAFRSGQGASMNVSRKGFVNYVKEGRLTPELANDAILSLSRYYPDPICEEQNWSVERDLTQPMWVTLPVPADAKEGCYRAEVTLKGLAGNKLFSFTREIYVKVYPVTIEKPSLWVTNWFTTADDKMKVFNGGKDVEPYSAEYWKMVGELASKLHECYTNVILVSPLQHIEFSEKSGKYSFDYKNFDRFIDVFRQTGALKMIEGGHIAARAGNWDSNFEAYVPEVDKDGNKKLVQYPINSEKASNFYRQFLPSLMSHLQKRGLKDIYVQHIADEPIESNFKSYVEIARFVKDICPDLKIIEACHTHNLENTVDIWVPQLNFYKDGYSFYQERQKAGDEVWFYTCLAPQGNFANRFLELPSIKTRLIHWLNFRYGATGYLHWGFNFWKENSDPYGETTTMNLESGNTLPGGDSWIVYPKNGKLYSSIRLEAMRDGIADYTLLQMLAQKEPDLAKELCRQVVFHWTLYDTDGDHFRAIRHQILEKLSEK